MVKKENNTQYTEYDASSIFSSKIAPHLEEIKKICKVNQIPFFFSCAVSNKKGKTIYENDGNPTGSNDIYLYDDMLERYLLVTCGAKLAPIGAINKMDDEGMDYLALDLSEDEGDDREDNIINIGDL